MGQSEPAEFDALVAKIRDSRLPSPAVRRETREAAGVSLREGADELNIAPMTLLRWERGDVEPRNREHALTYRRFLDALREALS